MVKSKRARDAVEAEEKPANVTSDAIEAPAKKRKRDIGEDVAGDVKKVKKDKKEKKDKKDKKNKKDKTSKASRRERKDKRKDLQDLPEQDSEVEDAVEQPAKSADADTPMADADSKPASSAEVNGDKESKKKDKKDKKSKKDKKKDDTDTPNGEANGDSTESKKEKKKNKKNKKTSDANDIPIAADNTNGAANGETNDEDNSKNDRHIVFVGNLPFSATAETIKAHFASLSPISVRCLRNKDDPNPCRGIAFVEFGKVWHMRTCLDKFHHSLFDDGLSPARKINVELTAGGGGKTKQRQEKIKEKNRKLDENRTKRIEKENTAKEENRAGINEDAIHPSRRGRVPNW